MAKIMFLQRIWFPLEGVMVLSTNLKKAGHQTSVSVGDPKKIMKEIKKYNPDIIAFPILTAFRKFMMDMVKDIKKEGIKSLILVGGYDASFFPEIIEKADIDVLCIGEGDDAIVELANAVDKGEDYSHIKNLWIKKEGKIIKNEIRPFKEVNERLLEDRDIYLEYDSFFKDIEFAQVMVGRGCPYTCSYCFNHKYKDMYSHVSKKYCDLRDVDNVINELSILKNKYNIKNIFFNDSTLGYDKKWIKEFLKKYKEQIGLPFTINACVNEVDEEFCRLLVETNRCYLVRIGLETGNENLRMGVLNKKIRNSEYIRAANLFKKYKIKYSMAIMLGLPGETLENSFETLEFANEISDKNSVVAVNIFKPFPRLNITEYGVKIGQYDSSLLQDENMIGDNVMNFYDCLRKDEEGKKILILSRFSQLYIHYPVLRGIIKNNLINYSDNKLFRIIWKFSDGYYTSRHHVNASWSYLFKYVFKHMRKGVRL